MAERERDGQQTSTEGVTWLYDDRADAGATLAEHLGKYAGRSPLVIGVARGGVPVAYEVATRLDAELDVAVACKLGAPNQQELALGAVAWDGTRALNHGLIEELRVPSSYLDRVAAEAQRTALGRVHDYRAGLAELDPAGRTVLLVDDGLATGATLRACIGALRKLPLEELVVAVPVGAAEGCDELAAAADDLVCPRRPSPFFAVGAHYRSFLQCSDDEVMRLLRANRAQRRLRRTAAAFR